MVNRKSVITEWFVFLAVALVASAINPPFGRLPGQDNLWADLAVLRTVAWAGEALKCSPWAVVDFLQGLGAEVRYDTKTIIHFFDPAVLLSVFVDAMVAVKIRGFVLVLYCLFSLSRLYRQQIVVGNTSEALHYPILLGYVIAPPLMGEVSHSFSPIFYTLPGLILSLRCFAKSPTPAAASAVVVATMLLGSLSDLNIAFIVPFLLLFVWFFDIEIRKLPAINAAFIILAIGVVIIADYWAVILVLFKLHGEAAAHVGSWTLTMYGESFLVPVLKGLIYPAHGYPHFSYIAPFLPLVLMPLVFGQYRIVYAKQLGLFVFLCSVLFALGVVGHGIDALRQKLPSAMRYHLAIIPFLMCLFIVYSRSAVEMSLQRMARSWSILAISGCLMLLIFFLVSVLGEYGLRRALEKSGMYGWRFVAFGLVWLLPTSLTLLAVVSGRLGSSTVSRSLVMIIGSVFFAGGFLVLRWCGLPLFTYVSHSAEKSLYNTLGTEINKIINASDYANATRSIVPVARGVYEPSRGRNDKLLPLQEYPEIYGGRSFFHYRYALSEHTAILYAITTGASLFAFPPSIGHFQKAVDFAETTNSPFLISADAEIDDPRVEKLGSVPIINRFINKRPIINPGLIGDIYVYGIKSLKPSVSGSSHTQHATYFRTRAEFRYVKIGEKLPITYFDSLRAYDETGQSITLMKRPDGFAQVAGGISPKIITVTSFAPWGTLSLLAPLFSWLLLLFAARWRHHGYG
jgi:hypothetical protein